jgi:thiamine biosynthesis protein ThiI
VIVLIRYNEITLKGRNRSWFEDILVKNIHAQIERETGQNVQLRKLSGRITLETKGGSETMRALEKTFGVASFSQVYPCSTALNDLSKTALDQFDHHVQAHGLPKNFRVATRRSDKAISQTSEEVDQMIGSEICKKYPSLPVQLKKPDLTLGIEVRSKTSYIWTEKHAGLDGLPVGTNAPVLALLSGGLDSPIAALRTLRRGSACDFIHFYGAPFVGEEALNKVEDLARMINKYTPTPGRLIVIPFGKIQEKIALATNPKLRTVIYRRMMVRISCKLAEKYKRRAIVTGESLGQVASQTIENLACINEVSTLPVIRPLICFNKDEIINEAKKYGTYELSIRPAADCCTLFADRNPAIRANTHILLEQESKIPVDDLINEAIDSAYPGESGR